MAVRLPWACRSVPWIRYVVALGLGLRLYHYLRDPSMWHDEAALVLNVLSKSFTELLGPLLFSEAAPPLFLWAEKLVVLTLGDGTYALRLVPFLASCASMILMVPVARRLLCPQAAPWALLLFACSGHLLWHACEAKPYAVDVLAATIVLAIYCSTENWSYGRRLLLYSALAPFLICLAYPGCFLCGGLLVAQLPTALRGGRLRDRVGYGFFTLVVLGAFALLLAGPVRAQRSPAILECWKGAFPSWDQPWTVPVWTVASSLEVARYCYEPIGQVLAVAAAAGAISLWRRARRPLLALLVLPIGLALVASCFGAYPYGGARVLVYAAPALALLTAEGVVPILIQSRDVQPAATIRPALVRACTVAILVVPLGKSLWRVVSPWPRADCAGAAAYVLNHRRPGEKVTATHWEYAYYFRHLGDSFGLLKEAPAAGDHFWLVATAGTRDDRLRTVWDLRPRGWRTVQQREFERTSVFLLSRKPEEGVAEALPRRED
jgi:hypothetical protein